ncbi:uncharacterized protein LOC109504251 isoform X2 [Harpegnathos saltator]|uniref:uncharacterized protein LOC109504251 isoform X2 n=1 Tax=Harpegnathos saltator TaxID=610380 RepID=UPI000DBEE413|nr:uncharacterized protein LOC109504251 isoform X2 [Harpegnathos saltator]
MTLSPRSRKIEERLDRMEVQFKQFQHTLETVLKCVRTRQDKGRAARKPDCLPISTEMEIQTFETVDDDIYEQVVDYLQYVGGFTVKEAINLAFKEVIKDNLTMKFTWFGCEGESQPLYISFFSTKSHLSNAI